MLYSAESWVVYRCLILLIQLFYQWILLRPAKDLLSRGIKICTSHEHLTNYLIVYNKKKTLVKIIRS